MKREIALPKDHNDISKGLDHVLQLTNPRLKDIPFYTSCGVGTTEVNKMKRKTYNKRYICQIYTTAETNNIVKSSL